MSENDERPTFMNSELSNLAGRIQSVKTDVITSLKPANKNTCDPRGFANLLLYVAHQQGKSLTNLVMQKLLYFAHATYLLKNKRPLISGFFEAWKYGPVHPIVYQAFKAAGDQPIAFQAVSREVLTGVEKIVPWPDEPEITALANDIFSALGHMSPGRLVEISHAPGAPWDFVVNKSETSLAFGMRITDNLIVERFKHHKVPVVDYVKHGEPSEDAPLTGD